jgi:hypothetical protein
MDVPSEWAWKKAHEFFDPIGPYAQEECENDLGILFDEVLDECKAIAEKVQEEFDSVTMSMEGSYSDGIEYYEKACREIALRILRLKLYGSPEAKA